MKTIFIRCTLALLFCLTAVSSWGQEVILSENFDSFDNDAEIAIEGWAFKYCYGRTSAYWTTKILTIQKEVHGKTDYGFATTPTLNYSGKAILSFKFCAAANGTSTVDISVSDGTIDGGEHTTVTSSNKTLTQKTFNLTLNQGATITFALTTETYAAIDDILIVQDGITISEALSNNTTISSHNGETLNVNTRRTLTGDIWNTLCLPFDVTMADMVLALGENKDIQLRTFSSYADNVMTFVNANETTIPAGTPFLVKLNTTVTDPTFHTVTISNTNARSVTNNGVSFKGTYSPLDLTSNNPDSVNLFLTKQNTLAIPAASSSTMNGLRAYFTVSSEFTPAATRIAIDDETTALQPATVTQRQPTGTYDLSGQRILHSRHGLYVVDGRLTFVK